MSIVGIVVGALVALVVYAVGTAITAFHHEGLVWGIIALLIWGAIAFGYNGRRIDIH